MIAIVIGSTGLVGGEIIKSLLARADIEKVISFVRRPTEQRRLPGLEKLEEHVEDFDKIESWKSLIKGDVLFSALGTTRSQAGSKEEQYKVDYQYQWDIARIAKENGVHSYVLISSVGADAESPFFYLQMKGELEKDIGILGFKKIRILRPAALKGQRKKPRLGESMGTRILDLALPLVPKALRSQIRPVEATLVADVAVRSAFKEHLGTLVYDSSDIWLD
ncbi:MAG: NAD(P)H-binding protein [Bdellovibrionales bacterium]|nr:NAD(P)H-binding protein [Bdellovibrionales bacterium]